MGIKTIAILSLISKIKLNNASDTVGKPTPITPLISPANTKIRKIIKKDILLKEIKNYDEILLIGSGKGVTSVKTINELRWKRKNLKKFKFLSKQYESVINKCNYYRF